MEMNIREDRLKGVWLGNESEIFHYRHREPHVGLTPSFECDWLCAEGKKSTLGMGLVSYFYFFFNSWGLNLEFLTKRKANTYIKNNHAAVLFVWSRCLNSRNTTLSNTYYTSSYFLPVFPNFKRQIAHNSMDRWKLLSWMVWATGFSVHKHLMCWFVWLRLVCHSLLIWYKSQLKSAQRHEGQMVTSRVVAMEIMNSCSSIMQNETHRNCREWEIVSDYQSQIDLRLPLQYVTHL